MKIVTSLFLFFHGLILIAQSRIGLNPVGGILNPCWMGWQFTPLGGSWLLSKLGLVEYTLGIFTGILEIISGIAILGAALRLIGLLIPKAWWRRLAGVGSGISLLLFVIYFHLLYLVEIGSNPAILVLPSWVKWPPPEMLGS